jgi:hypothetical protein
MSTKTYSRQYLRGLPEMHRRQVIQHDVDRLFEQIMNPLQAAALKGETRYLHDTNWGPRPPTITPNIREEQWDADLRTFQIYKELRQKGVGPPEGPSEELLAGLQEKFPDCAVSFHEDWIETRKDMRVLKKGILIDWS